MGSTEAIRRHFDGLRSEVEREFQNAEKRYRERLAGIANLEADMLGTQVVGAAPPNTDPDKGEPDDRPNTEMVLEVLDTDAFQTVEEIVAATDLTEPQVRGALYAKSMDKRIERRKLEGQKADFRRLPQGFGFNVGSSNPTHKEAVLDFLRQHPGGLAAKDIGDALEGKIDSTSKKPRSTIFSALHHLKTAGKVIVSESGIYTVAVGSKDPA